MVISVPYHVDDRIEGFEGAQTAGSETVEIYVDNGQVLTSAGTAAGIDACLHLVRLEHGAAVSNALARRMVVAPQRAGGQAQYVEAPVPRSDDAELAGLLDWARAHLTEPLTVEVLARQALMSPRTFARRFAAATGTTPHRWLLEQRLRHADHLLETTTLSVDEVARQCGLGSPDTLRHHFSHRRRGAVPEVARVLRPGGRLGLVWNHRDERVGWVAELGALMHRGVEQDMRSDDPPVGPPFGPLERYDVTWTHRMPRQGLVDLVASRSYVITLPAGERADLLAKVERLMHTHPHLAGRTDIDLPYSTRCSRTTRD